MRKENGCNTLLPTLRAALSPLQLPENSDNVARAHLRVIGPNSAAAIEALRPT
jgi:hypothetical protein